MDRDLTLNFRFSEKRNEYDDPTLTATVYRCDDRTAEQATISGFAAELLRRELVTITDRAFDFGKVRPMPKAA